MEIWKPIIEWEGLYEISNLGRVKRLPRERVYTNGTISVSDVKILKEPVSKHGYPAVSLYCKERMKHMSIHRLVAIHFIPNDEPEIKTEINHIDKDKNNYSIDNLEWCTRSENIRHSRSFKSPNYNTNKIVDLDKETKKQLSIQAAKKELSLKAYIEKELIKLSKK